MRLPDDVAITTSNHHGSQLATLFPFGATDRGHSVAHRSVYRQDLRNPCLPRRLRGFAQCLQYVDMKLTYRLKAVYREQ
jgi:hypothetical protein